MRALKVTRSTKVATRARCSGKTVPHSPERGRFVLIAMEARSSCSVMIRNSSAGAAGVDLDVAAARLAEEQE